MTAEADLIAAITAAPDDPAPFLVYADYLMSRGDPRGELIALMHAGDKGAAALMKTHKAAFIGDLARQASSIKLEAWRLGFVDHVRVIADSEKHALLLLDAIADHPSLRFARKLELTILGKRRSYAAVDARLAELARPQTLRHIALGKPGEHALSTALVEAFPHVAGEPRKTWVEIGAAIRALRGGAPGFATEAIAPPPSVALPVGDVVRGLAAEIDRKRPLGLVARLVDDCTPAALDELAAALFEAWTQQGEPAAGAWVHEAASLLGGARAARRLADRFGEISHQRAERVIDCLARMRTPLALLELHAASARWAARGEHAQNAVDAAARRATSDVPTLLARTGSDPRDAYDDATLARFRALDGRVLEDLMTCGWTAPLATVLDLFARAPRRAWSHGLVWRTPSGPCALAYDTCVDVHGEPIAVAPDAALSLVHPADGPIDPAWRAWQQGRAIPFEQLERRAPPHHSLDDLAPLVSWDLDIAALRVRSYRNGGLTNEVHEEQRFVKTHRYRGTTYTLAIQPSWGDRRILCGPTAALPPVVLFELARDLMAATRGAP